MKGFTIDKRLKKELYPKAIIIESGFRIKTEGFRMGKVVIVGGVRRPIEASGWTLRDEPVYRLGSTILDEAVKTANVDPVQINKAIMGQFFRNEGCANRGRIALRM